MDKQYIVVAGPVISRYDGQRHWIGAETLMRLYGVDRRVCYVLAPDHPARVRFLRQHPYLKILGPRRDGDYTIN